MPGETLDYYLLSHPGALLVEEFARASDGSAIGLRSAIWSQPHPGWRAAASFSRLLRTDRAQLSRVTPIPRRTAEETFHTFGAGTLPAEENLRTELADFEPFPTAPPLRLGPAGDTDRRYRVLFAKEPRNPPAILTAGLRRVGDDLFTWKLRRVGHDIGWALDVTATLATAADGAIAPLLHELTTALRAHGLIPVTTERFA